MSGAAPPRRIRARVLGTVQGVGFRPYVFHLAGTLDLAGFVRNDEAGVVLEVEGVGESVERFLDRLAPGAPPLARVEAVTCEDLPPTGERGFSISASGDARGASAPVTADAATCDDCLRELRDPADRRYRYPFINCTNCGPRFTIVRSAPYDRARTTMAGFTMCAACRREYEDPADRRFHAQPNACAACGPAVALSGPDDDQPLRGDSAVVTVSAALREGAIVAIKGIGGYHLACRADDERAVARLRARKRREDRPFAVMVRDVAAAAELAELSGAEAELLASRERPILLVARRPGAAVAASVAPASATLGLMLPYSPLHHLIVADAGVPLVMTSGNLSDEPIAFDDDDARERLGGIADLMLSHDRPIETRTDDSVAQVVSVGGRERPVLLRRSRGYVPSSIALPEASPVALLAAGAQLKSTFCLARADRAWVSHHVGDLGHYDTRRAYEAAADHFERLFRIEPVAVAHDLHPDYASTAYALAREATAYFGVQHHHAHLAACLAEHGETGPAIGAIFDGSGYGTDGTVWGGELLVGDLGGFRRAGHLLPVNLPGGEAAIREPWRMACAWLESAFDAEPAIPPAIRGTVDEKRWRAVASLARSGVGSPVTTSAGRLFDAVAALCGIGLTVSYEGQAAVEFAAVADRREPGSYPVRVTDGPDGVLLDPREAIGEIVRDLAAGANAGAVSARFHRGLAAATADAAAIIAGQTGVRTLVLSGGVFQNRLLLESVAARAAEHGLRVLMAERVPPNDGGISYGQAAVAAWCLSRGIEPGEASCSA